MTRTTYPFSGSEITRVKACLGSAVYPRINRTTKGAKMGSIRHRYLQRVNELGGDGAAVTQALAEIADEAVRKLMAALVLDGLPLDPNAYVAELGVAWDWETGRARELHRGGERDYSMLGPTEIPATLDSAAKLGDARAYVGDYKSEYSYQAPAREHAQLRFGLLAVSRLWHCYDGGLVEITRPRDSGEAWRDGDELDAFDLAEVAEEIRELAERVVAARRAYEERGVMPPTNVTDACVHCPAAHACPAQGQAIARVIDPAQQQLTRELAAKAYFWIKAAEARLEEYKGALRAYVFQQGDIPLGDGRVYGIQRRNHNVIEGRKLWQHIEQLHGVDAAWVAAEVKISMSSLDDALRPIAQKAKRPITHLKRELQERAAVDGAWRIVPDDEVRVFKPKEQL
jgi:hypothetical protein